MLFKVSALGRVGVAVPWKCSHFRCLGTLLGFRAGRLTALKTMVYFTNIRARLEKGTKQSMELIYHWKVWHTSFMYLSQAIAKGRCMTFPNSLPKRRCMLPLCCNLIMLFLLWMINYKHLVSLSVVVTNKYHVLNNLCYGASFSIFYLLKKGFRGSRSAQWALMKPTTLLSFGDGSKRLFSLFTRQIKDQSWQFICFRLVRVRVAAHNFLAEWIVLLCVHSSILLQG
jgi:hypothetical protein